MSENADLEGIEDGSRRLAAHAAAHAGLELLILHGSRARGASHAHSDWDFAYLASAAIDRIGLVADLVEATGSDRIDVADLDTAGALLRFRAARDGTPIFERTPGTFDRFWLDAVRFWFDAAPILGPEYEAVLDRLPR